MSDFDVKQLFAWLIPDPADCRKAAEELWRANPNATPEEHARLMARAINKVDAALS